MKTKKSQGMDDQRNLMVNGHQQPVYGTECPFCGEYNGKAYDDSTIECIHLTKIVDIGQAEDMIFFFTTVNKPVTKSEVQVKAELECFGNTMVGVEMEFEESFSQGDRIMFATCILSDAQEMMAIGKNEKARQFINKAKYHINKAKESK